MSSRERREVQELAVRAVMSDWQPNHSKRAYARDLRRVIVLAEFAAEARDRGRKDNSQE